MEEIIMTLNVSSTIPNDFFDYLKENLEKNYSCSSTEREIINLLFLLAMKRNAHPQALFQNWEFHSYSKKYSPEQAIALCEDFIHESLGYAMNFSETISILKVAFPNKVAP